MPQFFLPPQARSGENFRLVGPEAFHISKVLRCREGGNLDLFDGTGARYQGKITRLTSDAVEGVLTAALSASHAGSKVKLNLYQSLLKASRWEWILEKGTEVGVGCFIPVTTERTVVLLKDAQRAQAKGDRWKKIVLAAAKQCGRSDLPEVRAPMAFRDALKEAEGIGITLFAWEKTAGASAWKTLTQALAPLKNGGAEDGYENVKGPITVSLFIGPEGGFTDEEARLAESHHAHFFSLGPNILRGETAAITAASLVLYELGAL